MNSLFFEAAAKKFRYNHPTLNGVLNTEDLFGLKLPQLDTIAISLNRQVKELEEESFIKPKTEGTSLLNKQLDVVKAIITYKLGLEEKAAQKAALLAEREVLLQRAAELRQQELQEKFSKTEDVTTRIQELTSIINS